MKRRRDVILRVLQWLETRESPWNDPPDTLTDPASGNLMDPAMIKYHIDLCKQAGFIRKTDGNQPRIQLTWSGHEELAKWRGISPNGTPDELMLQQITAAIVAAVQPCRVILFGSAARGQMNEKSDFDLLVIKDGEHYRAVTKKIHMSLPARTRRVDVVVASSQDVQRHRHKPYYVIEPALREGRVLYKQTTQP